MKANDLLSQFGDHRQRVQSAITSVCEGRGILLVDDENRENEGDLIFSAQSMTEADMAIMIRHCSGIVCLCITEEKARQLNLPLMVEQNTSKYGTAFTISIEAAEGVTTGVSAADRIQTIRTAIAPNATPESLHHPGHIFPLIARSGGIKERSGHTEGSIDLMKLAGLAPCAVLCELTNDDGTMARLPEIIEFGLEHKYPVVTINDLKEYQTAPNFLPKLVGSFSCPAAENPTTAIMEAAFRHHYMHYRYINCEVGPENLAAAIQGAKAMGWRGFNCSLPNKVEIIRYLDELGESAKIIGAVNTVVIGDDQRTTGENTDGKGFVKAISEIITIQDKKIALLGAGGAARAIGGSERDHYLEQKQRQRPGIGRFTEQPNGCNCQICTLGPSLSVFHRYRHCHQCHLSRALSQRRPTLEHRHRYLIATYGSSRLHPQPGIHPTVERCGPPRLLSCIARNENAGLSSGHCHKILVRS